MSPTFVFPSEIVQQIFREVAAEESLSSPVIPHNRDTWNLAHLNKEFRSIVLPLIWKKVVIPHLEMAARFHRIFGSGYDTITPCIKDFGLSTTVTSIYFDLKILYQIIGSLDST